MSRVSKGILGASSVLVLALGAWLWWWTASGADLGSMERLVRRRFPSVPQISTAQLADWLKSDRPKPLLLDIREADEFAVSHLAGARNVNPETPVEKLQLGPARDVPIVTYCSVGYRSSGYAQQLREAGYGNVQNLEGSIFRWANEGRPLVKDGQTTDKVHPYSQYWGRLVKPEHRAPLK